KKGSGTLELMCHPGYCDETLAAASSYCREREEELHILMSPEFKDMLQGSGARLATYVGL
ncbi:MAG: ChbG/HpnK family deacetylase, partial [Gaiellales bacterium]